MNTYNKIFFFLCAFVIFAVVCLNVSLDVYRIFGIDRWNKEFVEENIRFLKTNYLISHRDYNAFIFGSSRANFYDSDLASKLSGMRYYNFSCQAERLDRILQKLVWLKQTGIAIDKAVIGLDFDLMFLSDDLPESALAVKEHPEVSGGSPVDFYIPFLFQFNWNNWKKVFKVKFGIKTSSNIKLDLETGNWSYPDKDEQISRDAEKYLKETFSNYVPYERAVGRVPVNLERLKELINFLDRESIPRIIIINPYYSETFKSFSKDEYRDWLSQVVSICGEVWDFSGSNRMTSNQYLYYDTSHFRLPMGNAVLKRILVPHSLNTDDAQKDFGVLLRDRI